MRLREAISRAKTTSESDEVLLVLSSDQTTILMNNDNENTRWTAV